MISGIAGLHQSKRLCHLERSEPAEQILAGARDDMTAGARDNTPLPSMTLIALKYRKVL